MGRLSSFNRRRSRLWPLWATLFVASVGCQPPVSAPTAAPANPSLHSPGQALDDAAPLAAATAPAAAHDDMPGSVADYLPLSPGSRWEYDVTYKLPLADPRQATAVKRADGERTIGGKSYVKLVLTVSIPLVPGTAAYNRQDAEGVYQIFEGEEDAGEWLYLPADLTAGKQWTAATKAGQCQFEFVGLEDVDLAGQVYRDCVHLSIRLTGALGSNQIEQWLAPGVGIVKQTDRNALFEQTSTLRRYVP